MSILTYFLIFYSIFTTLKIIDYRNKMTFREYFAERKSIRDQLEDLYSDKKGYTTSELLYLLDYEIEQIVEDVLRDHDSITETQRSDATYWVEREESGEESR